MLLTIYEQQTNEACYHDEIMSLLLQSALIYCMQNFRDTVKFLYAGTRLEGRMLEIMNYMFENYQNVTLRGLAHHFGYSEPYLCKLFREESGSTFTQILRDFKLKQAKKLLQTTDKKLNEICDTIGYSDTTQFIRDFKQQYSKRTAAYTFPPHNACNQGPHQRRTGRFLYCQRGWKHCGCGTLPQSRRTDLVPESADCGAKPKGARVRQQDAARVHPAVCKRPWWRNALPFYKRGGQPKILSKERF